MRVLYALLAIVPAVVLAQDGSGAVPETLTSIQDNPALTVPAHAVSSGASSISTPPANATATPVAGAQNTTAPSDNTTRIIGGPLTGNNASFGLPIGVNGTVGLNGTAINGTNGTNSSSGAMEMTAGAHTWPIAGLVAAAGAVGAIIL